MPWDGYAPMDIKEKVVAGERPHVPTTAPTAVGSLIRSAWDADTKRRPRFEKIGPLLEEVEDSLPSGASGLAALGISLPDDSLEAFARQR